MELYAIRYARNFAYANNGTIFRDSSNPSEPFHGFIFLFYLVKHNGKTLLIDTGFRDEALAKQMGITLLDVDLELDALIPDPSMVDTIIITHHHFDHIGNLDLYPAATILIAEPELTITLDNSSTAVKARLQSSHIQLIEYAYVLDDKLEIKVIGGHSPGSLVVYFEEHGKQYVITGDECYACDNILKNIPNGNCTDFQKNTEFIAEAHTNGLIPLPFHDDRIFSDYKQVSENVIRIV